MNKMAGNYKGRVMDNTRYMSGDSGLHETSFVRQNQQSRKFSQWQPAKWTMGVPGADSPYGQTQFADNVDDAAEGHYDYVSDDKQPNERKFIAEERRAGTHNQERDQLDVRSNRANFQPIASAINGHVEPMQRQGIQGHPGNQEVFNGHEIHQRQQDFQGIQGQDIHQRHQGFQGIPNNQVHQGHQEFQNIQGQQYWQHQQQQYPHHYQHQQHQHQQQHQQHHQHPQHQQQQYHNGQVYTVQPPMQEMTREDPNKPPESKIPVLKDPIPRCLLVFKRLCSAALIIADTVLDWMEYTDALPENVSDTVDTIKDVSSLVIGFGHGKHSKTEVGITSNCEAPNDYYLLFTILGTILALVQLADIIGETIPEMTTKYKGFRVLHGFNEVLFSYALEEIPPAICLIFVSFKCGCDFDFDMNGKGLRKLYSTLFGFLSGYARKSTCRQIVKPCCYYELDFPMFCCFVPLCEDPEENITAGSCNCYKCPPCDFCNNFKLSCAGIFGVDDRQRKCTDWMIAKLSKLFILVTIVHIIAVAMRQCL